jgi:hypothetical protein
MAVPSGNHHCSYYKLWQIGSRPLQVDDLRLCGGEAGKSGDLPAIKHFLTDSGDD